MKVIDVKPLLSELKAGLQDLYGDRLRGVYLFGSYARGTAEPESDVDVLIVLDEVTAYGREIKRTGYLASDLSLKYGSSVSRVFISEAAWASAEIPFLLNVRQDAVAA